MVRRLVVPLFALMVSVVGASAQAPPPDAGTAGSENPAAAALAARVEFARDAYKLGEGDSIRLKSVLAESLPKHELYMLEHAATLRRTRMALHELLPQQNYEPEMRQKLEATFKGQLCAMYANAPLSMTNVVRRVESSLPKGVAAERRQWITQHYADVLKGEPLDFELIDEAVVRSKHDETQVRPGAAPSPSAARPAAPPPASVPQLKPATPIRTNPPVAQAPPVPPTTAPAIKQDIARVVPPRPPVEEAREPEPPPPAPPVGEWSTRLEALSTKYGFTPEQRTRAESVWKNCSSRAEAHLQNNRPGYEEANHPSDSTAKARKLKEPNQPIDKLFAEMNQRIESIASLEQKDAAEKKNAAEKK